MAQRILVVEDEEAARCSLSNLLSNAGYDVAQAQDYRDALPVLEDGRGVDLLVTDIVMPGVHGFALARMARFRHREIKVVYITSCLDVPENEASGPILHKPVDPDVLLETVRDALEAA